MVALIPPAETRHREAACTLVCSGPKHDPACPRRYICPTHRTLRRRKQVQQQAPQPRQRCLSRQHLPNSQSPRRSRRSLAPRRTPKSTVTVRAATVLRTIGRRCAPARSRGGDGKFLPKKNRASIRIAGERLAVHRAPSHAHLSASCWRHSQYYVALLMIGHLLHSCAGKLETCSLRRLRLAHLAALA